MSAETELAPLSRAGSDGSDWKAGVCSDAVFVGWFGEMGLVTSLGLVKGVPTPPFIDSLLDVFIVIMVFPREGLPECRAQDP